MFFFAKYCVNFDGYGDSFIAEQIIGEEEISEEDPEEILKSAANNGYWPYYSNSARTFYLSSPEKIVNRSGEDKDPLGVGAEAHKRFFSVPSYRSLLKKMFGAQNYNNLEDFVCTYSFSSGRKTTFSLPAFGYKRNLNVVEHKVPIRRILYVAEDKQHMNEIRRANIYVQEQTIFMKVLELFAEPPCYITQLNNQDIGLLEEQMKSLGYLQGKVIQKFVFFERDKRGVVKSASVLYQIQKGENSSLSKIVLHSNTLTKEERNLYQKKFQTVINSGFRLADKKSIDVILGFEGCTAINFLSKPEKKFEIHLWVEKNKAQNYISHLFFQGFSIYSQILYKLARNNKVILGGEYAEKNVQGLLKDLEEHTGAKPEFNPSQDESGKALYIQKGIPTEGFDTKPNFSLSTSGIGIKCFKKTFYNILGKLWFFSIQPSITASLISGGLYNSLRNLQINPGLSTKFLSSTNTEFFLELDIPLKPYGAVNFLTQKLQLGGEKQTEAINFGSRIGFLKKYPKFHFGTSFNYNFKSPYVALKEMWQNLSKNNSTAFTEGNFSYLDYHNFSINPDFTYKLYSNLNKNLFFIWNPALFFDIKDFFAGFKSLANLHYKSQLFNLKITHDLYLGIALESSSPAALINSSDVRVLLLPDYFYSNRILAFRTLLLREIFDSASLIGVKIASLCFGFFFNIAYIASLDKTYNTSLKKGVFASVFAGGTGLVCCVDIMTFLMFFLAVGVNVRGELTFDFGLIISPQSTLSL